MPPKIKTPDGEMNATQLRKLIRGHNILVTIKIPKGTDRLGLIKLIEGKGYKVDHKKKALIDAKKDRPRRPQVTLKNAVELTISKPKTLLQKNKQLEKKEAKIVEDKKKERDIKKKAIDEERNRKKNDREKELKNKNISNNIGMKGQEKKVVDFYGKTDKTYKDPPVTKQPVKKKVEPKKTESMDFKIGDTYLFKIKTKEFEGIAIRINAKSVTMLLRWLNGNIIDKPIKKDDVIKRLGGTNYDEDLGETYTMSIEKKKPKKKVVKSDSERLTELMKKLGYKNLPYPAQLLDSEKLKKLMKKQKELREEQIKAKGSAKKPIMKELAELKKLIDAEKDFLRKNPKKLSKDEQELLELINNMNMN
tara:strand:+ start:44 stop:1132 length:1089 start_codon:yes stop_codon:yes gene_type:complete